VFKHKEDIVPSTIFVLLIVLDFIMYFTIESTWLLVGYWLLMLLPKGTICAWNHHHQHVSTFKSVFMNRLMEQVYALHTGQTTNLWVLHHVLGHHYNYLDQTIDESRWKRKSGEKMGELEYTLDVTFTAYQRAYAVGKSKEIYKRHLDAFLLYGSITALIVLALVIYKPMQGFFLFALPMFVSLMFTAWVTYEHHAGLDTDDHMHASYNTMSPFFNKLTGNLGYHTAHHYRQGVHWSRLPALHEKIKHKIPDELYTQSLFDVFSWGKQGKI